MWLALATALLATGCQPSSLASRRVQARLERVSDTAQTWAAREQSRPDKLQRAAEFIDRDLRQNAERLRRDGQYVVQWQARNVTHWRARQPVYRDKAAQLLWGKPERIERSAIILFF